VRSWVRIAIDLWTLPLTVPLLTARWRSMASVILGYVTAADRACRMDLARVVMRFVVTLCTEVLAGGGDLVRGRIASNPGLRNVRERNELLSQVERVVSIGNDLLRRRDGLAGERYGDDRYEEAQLYLRAMADVLTPARRSIDDVARALSSTIA
jgi:hypothetical protein